MALESSQIVLTYPASADLSASQFCFVNINTSGQLALPSGAGVGCDGVLQDKPKAITQGGSLCVLGQTKVLAGAAVAIGDSISCDSSGRGITTTSTNKVLGKAVSAASAAGQLFTMLIEKVVGI